MRTILIADDHVLMREALMHLIASAFESVVFECVSGFHETEHRLRALSSADHPDGIAVILDLRMPGMSGLASVQCLLAAAKSCPIVVYSEVDSPVTRNKLLELGVFAVECKSEGVESLLTTLHRALNVPVNSDSAHSADSDLTPIKPSALAISGDGSVELTSRQMDMLRALHRGLPNKLIAREYGVALGTVKNHLFILYERLGVRSRSEALHKTREWFL